MLGRHTKIVGTIITLQRQRTLTYEYKTGPIPGLWTYRLSSVGSATRMHLTLEMPSRGLGAEVREPRGRAAGEFSCIGSMWP